MPQDTHSATVDDETSGIGSFGSTAPTNEGILNSTTQDSHTPTSNSPLYPPPSRPRASTGGSSSGPRSLTPADVARYRKLLLDDGDSDSDSDIAMDNVRSLGNVSRRISASDYRRLDDAGATPTPAKLNNSQELPHNQSFDEVFDTARKTSISSTSAFEESGTARSSHNNSPRPTTRLARILSRSDKYLPNTEQAAPLLTDTSSALNVKSEEYRSSSTSPKSADLHVARQGRRSMSSTPEIAQDHSINIGVSPMSPKCISSNDGTYSALETIDLHHTESRSGTFDSTHSNSSDNSHPKQSSGSSPPSPSHSPSSSSSIPSHVANQRHYLGLPVMPFVALSVCLFANACSVTVLFPFIYFMIQDFGIAEDDNHIGTLVFKFQFCIIFIACLFHICKHVLQCCFRL